MIFLQVLISYVQYELMIVTLRIARIGGDVTGENMFRHNYTYDARVEIMLLRRNETKYIIAKR